MSLEIYRKSVKRFLTAVLTLSILAILTLSTSLSLGTSKTFSWDVLPCVLSFLRGCDEGTLSIAKIRVARTLASFFGGSALGVAGVLTQAITRNPLAEPYILGLSSTALTAVALTFLVSSSLVVYRGVMILIAFAGALIGYFLTLTLSRLAGNSSHSLILAGIAVTSFFSGISHILLYLVQGVLRTPYVFLLMGSTSYVLLEEINYIAIPTVLATAAVLFLGLPKMLNAYIYGDEHAKQLGFNPKYVSTLSAFISSLLTASVVAVLGIIGFLGLAVPHITRALVGSDHRYVVPTAFVVGGLLLTLADVCVRLISLTPLGLSELPVGIVTSVMGAPFLAYLILRGGSR
ncbi:MAG: hypothetical protein B7O98_00880 [Zestosphaera tikiterensis]|uniref:Iron ABC transporter permease n=1 Tax=Zestosphaera tikiterensis TaxID=1973259 RepID=A0A2R7Y9K7_9CREN|nr:MAG: hypothetical protein B7O98_00880 [Zestosphaera tikiterensis]